MTERLSDEGLVAVLKYPSLGDAWYVRALALEVQEWRRLAAKAPSLVRTDREQIEALWRQERDARKEAETLCDAAFEWLDDLDWTINGERIENDHVDELNALFERWRASQTARGET